MKARRGVKLSIENVHAAATREGDQIFCHDRSTRVGSVQLQDVVAIRYVDGAAVVGSVAGLSPNENLDVSFLLSLSLVADPKEKGLVASLEAAGAVVLASLVVAPNENPPEADEVVAVDEASNLKPPEDAAAVSLVAAATNLKPAEEDVVVELVEAGAPN